MRVLEAGEQKLVFVREFGTERLRCTFNLSEQPAPFSAEGTDVIRAGRIEAGSLGPYGAIIEVIT
jgi:hypothetical protein